VADRSVRLEVNGTQFEASVPVDRTLLAFLREDLGMTGTKEGCGVGVCGSCSVLVDDNLVSACLLLVVLADGAAIRTVEGLADDGVLTPLQEEFIRHGGYQCGICTPGQLVAATALLEHNPDPSPREIRSWLMGNLCRCTGYYRIVEAVSAATPGEAISTRVQGDRSS
jgi:carbon-monoxide dehydrogenase small subunit